MTIARCEGLRWGTMKQRGGSENLSPLYTDALKCPAAVTLLGLENLLCIYSCLPCVHCSITRGGNCMDRDSFEASLLEDGFDSEDAEMIADDWEREFGNDPDFDD